MLWIPFCFVGKQTYRSWCKVSQVFNHQLIQKFVFKFTLGKTTCQWDLSRLQMAANLQTLTHFYSKKMKEKRKTWKRNVFENLSPLPNTVQFIWEKNIVPYEKKLMTQTSIKYQDKRWEFCLIITCPQELEDHCCPPGSPQLLSWESILLG